MFGAIVGDIVGSRFEFRGKRIKTTDFELFTEESHFTDDTVLTVATADAILEWSKSKDSLYIITRKKYISYASLYPDAGYGGRFKKWIKNRGIDLNDSFGNGAAMRISPLAYLNTDLQTILFLSDVMTKTSHNSEEGLKAARAVTSAIYLLRNGTSKNDVEKVINESYYDMNINLDEIRPNYKFDSTCQGSVPQALKCFFDSDSFESAIRLAVSLGGDTDTQAAIAGSLADAYYGIPEDIANKAKEYLPDQMISVINKFESKYRKV